MVPTRRFELPRLYQWILSPPRLPFRHVGIPLKNISNLKENSNVNKRLKKSEKIYNYQYMKKDLNKVKKFTIKVHKMKPRDSALFIASMSISFLLGICLILTGVFFNNNTQNAFTNAYSISGIVILCFTLLTVTLLTLISNYGGKLSRLLTIEDENKKSEDNKENIEQNNTK